MNKIGWKKINLVFIKLILVKIYPQSILIVQQKIKEQKKIKYFKKYINKPEQYDFDDNLISAIITPDKDIIPGSKALSPAYLVFNNYEKVLKWNRSLRFALAVCTLKDKFKNEI